MVEVQGRTNAVMELSMLSSYPIGQSLGFKSPPPPAGTNVRTSPDIPALTALDKLADYSLDPYLSRLMPEVLNHSEKMKQMPVTMVLEGLSQPVQIGRYQFTLYECPGQALQFVSRYDVTDRQVPPASTDRHKSTFTEIPRHIFWGDQREESGYPSQAKPMNVRELLRPKLELQKVPDSRGGNQTDRTSAEVFRAESASVVLPSSDGQGASQGTWGRGQQQSMTLENQKQAVLILDAVLLLNTTLLDIIKQRAEIAERLKRGLCYYVKMIDRILLNYCHNKIAGDLPELDEVIKKQSEIQEILNRMNPEMLGELIPEIFAITQESILCSVLGLDNNIGSQLHALTNEWRCHQSDLYWIKQFVSERRAEAHPSESLNTNHENIVAELCRLGFTSSRADIIADWIVFKVPCFKQQPLYYWVNKYLEMMFDYNILLCEKQDYAVNREEQNKWNYEEVMYEDEDEEPLSFRIGAINTSAEEAGQLLRDNMAYPPSDLWFHATDYKSAWHIVRNGIHLGKGNQCQDFSDGSSFYVNQSYEYALEWAKAHPVAGAIVVYRVTRGQIDQFDGIKLEDYAKWTDLVRYNRAGRDSFIHKIEKELKMEYKKTDYVEGAMVGNGITKDQAGWIPERIGNQLCILSEDMAALFGQAANIDAIIFI